MEILRRFWEGWKRVGRFIGDLIGRLVLTLLYFTLVLPFGIGLRFGGDPLQLKRTQAPTFWAKRQTRDLTLKDASRQF